MLNAFAKITISGQQKNRLEKIFKAAINGGLITHLIFDRGLSFSDFGSSSTLLQRLIEQIQNLPVGTTEFIRSPFFDGVHGIRIDAKHKAFIFCILSQNCNYKKI